jgi:hypothetical protein
MEQRSSESLRCSACGFLTVIKDTDAEVLAAGYRSRNIEWEKA